MHRYKIFQIFVKVLIANLCSATKIFERLILNRISKIELEGKVNLTGNCQHGFKKSRGTVTAGLQLQSLISRALDDDEFVAMASLDLSAAFDVVNVPLLITRLRVVGLPNDVIRLIEVWLTERLFYVEVDGVTSYLVST